MIDKTKGKDEVRAVFLNARSDVPVEVRLAANYQTFNALVGATTGTVVGVTRMRSFGAAGDIVAWCDDEGLLTNREPNEMASRVCGQPIVGDALVLAYDANGEADDLLPAEVIAVGRAANGEASLG